MCQLKKNKKNKKVYRQLIKVLKVNEKGEVSRNRFGRLETKRKWMPVWKIVSFKEEIGKVIGKEKEMMEVAEGVVNRVKEGYDDNDEKKIEDYTLLSNWEKGEIGEGEYRCTAEVIEYLDREIIGWRKR